MLFINLHQAYFKSYLLMVILFSFLGNLGYTQLVFGNIIISVLYMASLLFSIKRMSKTYALVFLILLSLNLIDSLTTWIATSFSIDGISSHELNPIVRSFFSSDSIWLGFLSLSLLKLVMSLFCLQPLYYFLSEIIEKKRSFILLGTRQLSSERNGFYQYINFEIKRFFSGCRMQAAQIDGKYVDYIASYLLRGAVSGISILSLVLLVIDLNNISYILFELSWLIYLWGSVLGGLIILFRFFIQERLICRIYACVSK
jgi:hypothetical protein